jgi:hypothetical protein
VREIFCWKLSRVRRCPTLQSGSQRLPLFSSSHRSLRAPFPSLETSCKPLGRRETLLAKNSDICLLLCLWANLLFFYRAYMCSQLSLNAPYKCPLQCPLYVFLVIPKCPHTNVPIMCSQLSLKSAHHFPQWSLNVPLTHNELNIKVFCQKSSPRRLVATQFSRII